MPSPGSGIPIARQDLDALIVRGLRQSPFIINDILVPIQMPRTSGSYARMGPSDIYSDWQVDRKDDGTYNRITWRGEDDSWKTSERGLEAALDDRKKEAYLTGDRWRNVNLMMIANGLMRRHERIGTALLTDTAVFTGSTNFYDVSTGWLDDDATVIDDAMRGHDAIYDKTGMFSEADGGGAYTVLVVPYKVYKRLSYNKQILARYPGAGYIPGSIPRQQIADALGVSEIKVAGAVYQSSAPGMPLTLEPIWPVNRALLCIVNQNRDVEGFGVGSTRYWRETGDVGSDLYVVEDYRDESARSEILRVRHDVQAKLESTEAAFLLDIG